MDDKMSFEEKMEMLEAKANTLPRAYTNDGQTGLSGILSIKTRGIPRLYKRKGFNEFDSSKQRKAYQRVTSYEYPGKGMILCGTPGTGKTHLACALLSTVTHTKPLEGAFFVVPELLARFSDSAQKGGKISDILDVVSFDVIVLDDLTDTNLTEAKRENLFLLLNRIELEGRILIATSNMMPEELGELGGQIQSRLLSLCDVIPMIGEDMRLKQ